MFASLLLLASVALADSPEIAHGKDFGVGVVVGLPPIAFTGKYWFDNDNGLAFYGAIWPPNFFEARVQYDRRFVEFGDWDFGDVGMYFHVGVASRYFPVVNGSDYFVMGPSGGVGGLVRFKAVPAEAFAEMCTEVYAVGWSHGWGDIDMVAGGRWYF